MFDTFESRLTTWNQLKKALETDPEPFWLLIRYYDQMNLEPITMDPWNPDTWLGPWEMISHDSYCEFSVSLAMYYSLCLVDRFKNSNIELLIVMDTDNSSRSYPIRVDDTIVNLNQAVYDLKRLPDTIIVEKTYQNILGE